MFPSTEGVNRAVNSSKEQPPQWRVNTITDWSNREVRNYYETLLRHFVIREDDNNITPYLLTLLTLLSFIIIQASPLLCFFFPSLFILSTFHLPNSSSSYCLDLLLILFHASLFSTFHLFIDPYSQFSLSNIPFTPSISQLFHLQLWVGLIFFMHF